MSERWKFQIRSGLTYGIIAAIISGLFRLKDKTFDELFLSYQFLVRLLVFIAVGIFALGYWNWKSKQKEFRK